MEFEVKNKDRFVYFFTTHKNIGELVSFKSHIEIAPKAELNVDIPGFFFQKDYITEEEEQEILKNLPEDQWHFLNKRRVQHYGYEFIYGKGIEAGKNKINKNNKIGPFPAFLDPIV